MSDRIKAFPLTCLTLILVATAWTQSPQSPLDIAKQELKDKTLLLRGFPTGRKIEYTASGDPISLQTGIWTVDGFLRVKSVELKQNDLRIRGQRLAAIYNEKSKKMDLTKYEDTAELSIAVVDGPMLESALKRVFVEPPERPADVAPPYWKKFLEEGVKDQPKDKTPATSRPCKPPENGVYQVCRDVTPPEPTYKPEPTFSQFARRFRLTGKVTVTTVVDPTGTVAEIEIATPCGAGFDEQVIAAVSKWRFKPATKDGQPVAVRIAIDVDFTFH